MKWNPVARNNRLIVIAAGFLFLVIFLLAVFAPKILIVEVPSTIPAEQRSLATRALDLARIGCLDQPIEQLLTRAVSIKEVNGDEQTQSSISATVQSYSFFAIPRKTISIEDGAITCHASAELGK